MRVSMSTASSPSTFVARQARAVSQPATAVTLGSSPAQATGTLVRKPAVSTEQTPVSGAPLADRTANRLAAANTHAAAAYGVIDAQRDALVAATPRDWSRGTVALDAYRAVSTTDAQTSATDLQL